eukprot:122033_1
MNNFTTQCTFSQFADDHDIQNTTPPTKSASRMCSNQIQKSISVEEPMPSSFPSEPSAGSHHFLHHKRNVSDLRVFVFESELETVSETFHHDPQHKSMHEYATYTNLAALSSPDSTSPFTREHVHTYSNGTTSTVLTSPGSVTDANYIPLSPINREQAHRNIVRQNSFDRIMCEIPTIVDEVITKCNSDHAANNASNTHNAQGYNNPNGNGNNDNQHQGNNSGGGSGSGCPNNHSNHSGSGGGDDEKKKDNDHHMDADDDDDEATKKPKKKEDKKEQKEDANERKLNRNAVPFIPIAERDRSKSANAVPTLSTIDEHNILNLPTLPATSMSAPMMPMPSPVLPNKLAPLFDRDYNDQEDVKQRSVSCESNAQWGYTPAALHRAQGWIKIPKVLTTTIIPDRIAQSPLNPYDFMDKSTGIAMCNDNAAFVFNDNVIVLNYGFRDKHSNKSLYVVAEKHAARTKSKRNCKYSMHERLYTRDELCDLYKPRRVPRPNHQTLMDLSHKVNQIFDNPAALCAKYIFRTKWHKLPVFHGMNNDKKYNKQRLTFAMTKTEFISVVQRYVHNNHNDVIPIVMFNGNGCRVEYVQIVQIRPNIAIGISYTYNTAKKSIKATGIHLDKNNIMRQHQLCSPQHHCTCLDGFHSDIDDLHIGNPDDDKNRVKDLKKKNDGLNDQLKGKKKRINALEMKNRTLEDQLRQLTQYIRAQNIQNMYSNVPPAISPLCPQYIEVVTPQSLSISVTPSSYYNYTPQSARTNTSTTSSSQSRASITSAFGQQVKALGCINNGLNCNTPNNIL